MSWKLPDGTDYDISAATIALKVKGGFSLVPEADPENAKGRLIHFTKEHAATLSYRPEEYHVVITENGEDALLFAGKISAVGFA